MLLSTPDFSEQLINAIAQAENSVLVASAFIKVEALKTLSSLKKDVDVVVISRWQKHDLISSASDLEVYRMCESNGWKFGICQNFHGKLYLVDRQDIFLGSANFTQRGLNLGVLSNIEFGTVIPAENVDLDKIGHFLNTEIIWPDENQFRAIENEIKLVNLKTPLSESDWSGELKEILATKVEYLWMHELIFKTPQELLHLKLNDDNHRHDYELLNLDIDTLSSEAIIVKFKKSRLYCWVISLLDHHDEMNFGALTHALHNALLDDPLPYRKDIKELIVILFSWFEFLEDDFIITKHRKTSSVKRFNKELVNG